MDVLDNMGSLHRSACPTRMGDPLGTIGCWHEAITGVQLNYGVLLVWGPQDIQTVGSSNGQALGMDFVIYYDFGPFDPNQIRLVVFSIHMAYLTCEVMQCVCVC